MRRLIVLLIVILILMSGSMPTPTRARAEVNDCDQYPFPGGSFGWHIVTGTLSDPNVLSPSDRDDIEVYLDLGTDIRLYTIGVNAYLNPLATFTWYTTKKFYFVDVTLEDAGGHVVDIRRISFNQVSWNYGEAYFNGTSARRIRFLGQRSVFVGGTDGTIGGHAFGLNVRKICTVLIPGDPTETPTGATPTPSQTRTATATTVPSITATPTATLTPSETPTGTIAPTNTPGPTNTPAPTGTTAGSLQATVPSFLTPDLGDQCSDAFNPCGVMPFPVPDFPTVGGLVSPTAFGVGGTPSPGATGTPAYDPSSTVNPTIAVVITGVGSGLSDQSDTLNTMTSSMGSGLNGTPQFSLNGTPQTVAILSTEIGGNAGTFVGYVKGITLLGNSRLFSMLLFFFLCIVFVVTVRIITFMVPMIIKLVQFILEVVQTIKPL
jgi:hypothetical protein